MHGEIDTRNKGKGAEGLCPCTPKLYKCLKLPNPQYTLSCIGPRTHQARKLWTLAPRSTSAMLKKLTAHARVRSGAIDDADQKNAVSMPVKTVAGTKGAGSEGSCTLFNSITDGNRQPTVPPTVLLAQCLVAPDHPRGGVGWDLAPAPTRALYYCPAPPRYRSPPGR